MEDYLGMIRMFAGNFVPRNYLPCNGSLLAISQFSALFSILGTTYGGDGRTTFGLPDFRGRVPLSAGQGPGLSNYTLGSKHGAETVTLTKQQMPAHNHHAVVATTADTDKARGSFWAENTGGGSSYGTVAGANTMSEDAITNEGGNQAHTNIQPYQCVTFVICYLGIYPSRQVFDKDGNPTDEIAEEDKNRKE